MSIQKFYWKRPEVAEPLGILTYDTMNKQFTIEVLDVDRKLLPISLAAIRDNNRSPLSGELANTWVASRVEPPDRANISDILKCAGLITYDVFGLLLYHNGRAVYDTLYLEEIEPNIS